MLDRFKKTLVVPLFLLCKEKGTDTGKPLAFLAVFDCNEYGIVSGKTQVLLAVFPVNKKKKKPWEFPLLTESFAVVKLHRRY